MKEDTTNPPTISPNGTSGAATPSTDAGPKPATQTPVTANNDNPDGDDFAIGNPASTVEIPDTDDVFADINNFRLDQDFNAGVKRQLVTIHCCKPRKEWFFRTSRGLRLPTGVLEVKEMGDYSGHYLIAPRMVPHLSTDPNFRKILLVGAINRQQLFFWWPLIPPGGEGDANSWHQSALEAAKLAEDKWTRMAANKTNRAYDLWFAPEVQDPPEWPEQPANELLRICFKERIIKSLDHPIVQKLKKASR